METLQLLQTDAAVSLQDVFLEIIFPRRSVDTQRAGIWLRLGVSSHVTNKLIFLVTFIAAERTVPLVDTLVASLTFFRLRTGPEGLGAASARVLLLSGVTCYVKLISRVPFEAFTAEFAAIFLQIFLQMLILYMN